MLVGLMVSTRSAPVFFPCTRSLPIRTAPTPAPSKVIAAVLVPSLTERLVPAPSTPSRLALTRPIGRLGAARRGTLILYVVVADQAGRARLHAARVAMNVTASRAGARRSGSEGIGLLLARGGGRWSGPPGRAGSAGCSP